MDATDSTGESDDDLDESQLEEIDYWVAECLTTRGASVSTSRRLTPSRRPSRSTHTAPFSGLEKASALQDLERYDEALQGAE